MRELIREDERRRAQEQIESLLLEGLASEKTALRRQDFDDIDIRREALARVQSRQQR